MTFGDLPDTLPAFKIIAVGGADHLYDVINSGTHTIHVTDTMCPIGTVKFQSQVGCQVMGFTPGRVQDIKDRLADTFMTVKCAKWRADFPDGIFMPD